MVHHIRGCAVALHASENRKRPWPSGLAVAAQRSTATYETVKTGVLSGENVLPGFTCTVAELFV
jgi:hypothetical protein